MNRHPILEIVRNFETWVPGELLYELEHKFSEQNKFRHRTNYLTVYRCHTTFIKITHHRSLLLELRADNCNPSDLQITKRDMGLCFLWNLILLVNSPSNMKFIIIRTLPHSSLLPLNLLGNWAFEKIWSLKSGPKKEYLYKHTHLDSLPSSSNNIIAVKSTNTTAITLVPMLQMSPGIACTTDEEEAFECLYNLKAPS